MEPELASIKNPIETYLKKKLPCPEDAEDVLQEVLLRVWKNQHQWNSTKGKFIAWVQTIAKHAVFDFYKAKSRQVQTISLTAAVNIPAGTDAILAVELRENINQCLQTLLEQGGNDNIVKAFYLREVLGHTHAEIAKIVGCTVHASILRCLRCRQKLKEKLKERGYN